MAKSAHGEVVKDRDATADVVEVTHRRRSRERERLKSTMVGGGYIVAVRRKIVLGEWSSWYDGTSDNGLCGYDASPSPPSKLQRSRLWSLGRHGRYDRYVYANNGVCI
jgi:hypothetical protein